MGNKIPPSLTFVGEFFWPTAQLNMIDYAVPHLYVATKQKLTFSK